MTSPSRVEDLCGKKEKIGFVLSVPFSISLPLFGVGGGCLVGAGVRIHTRSYLFFCAVLGGEGYRRGGVDVLLCAAGDTLWSVGRSGGGWDDGYMNTYL